MITKIGYELNSYYNKKSNNSAAQRNQLPYRNTFIGDTISFTAKKKKSDVYEKKLDDIMLYSDTSAKNLLNDLKKEAFENNYSEVTPMLVMRHSLNELYEYLKDVESGKKSQNKDIAPPMYNVLNEEIHPAIYSDKSNFKKLFPILEKYLHLMDDVLDKTSKTGKSPASVDDVKLSDELIDNIWSWSDNNDDVSSNVIFLSCAQQVQDRAIMSMMYSMCMDLCDSFMQNNKSVKERMPFSGYENKAAEVLRNLSLGTNMFVTYDIKAQNPRAFIDTIHKLHEEQGDQSTKILELNAYTTDSYLGPLMEGLREDPLRNYIVILDPSAIIMQRRDEKGNFIKPENLTNAILNPPQNVKFLFHDVLTNYDAFLGFGLYKSFKETGISLLSSDQMVQYFKENQENLMKDVSTPYTDAAIEKVVLASANLDGVFPTKTQELIKKITSYYNNKKEITEEDVNQYLKESAHLFKKADDKSAILILQDTKKHLSDMTGKDSTKKDAQLIVDQILNNELGTKGVLIYSQDGTPGAGRHFTAKAIAGDAHVPYIETNAIDFTTEEVELIGDTSSPVAAMKNLFSLVKTQAETNPHKSAVLFIENFEYLSISEAVSRYNEKAMAQLIREMNKAQDEGFNILVMGSIPSPEWVGEAAMKSFKFNDNIAVASPMNNAYDRKKIIEKALEDDNIRFANDDYDRILKFSVDLTSYNSYIEIKSLIKKAKSVAVENGHEDITKADISEAFLQLEYGRPNEGEIAEHSKRIVTSHECGHATNIQVINNAAKTLGKPWHVPNKVNFVTLDPRGWFGGCVFPGKDTNDEESFEKVFSSLIFMFGGYSTEKTFYGMDGSLGISMDMKYASNYAKRMVREYGMGPTVGAGNVQDYSNASDKMKEMIENDERLLINNARAVSDMITNVYAGFNEWFTKKYSPLVGTGNCMIDGDEFREALQKWRSEQSPEKQKELDKCDQAIIKIMEATKKGIMVKRAE